MFMNAFFFLLLPERRSSRGYRLTLKRKIHFLNVINPRSWWEVISGPLPWWKWRGINRATYFQIPLSVGKELSAPASFPGHLTATQKCVGLECVMTRESIKETLISVSQRPEISYPRKEMIHFVSCSRKYITLTYFQIQMEDFFLMPNLVVYICTDRLKFFFLKAFYESWMCRLSNFILFFQTLLSTVESMRLASQESGSFPTKRLLYSLVARGGGCSCLGMSEFRLLQFWTFLIFSPMSSYSPDAPPHPPAHPHPPTPILYSMAASP